MSGTVHAVHEFQGDLVIGGMFDRVESTHSRFVARLHDGDWEDIGSGLPGYRMDEYAGVLAEYGGQLVAGGRLLSTGSTDNYVGIFDGSSWTRMGETFLDDWTYSRIHDLVEFDTYLIASGSFSAVGDSSAAGVARWDGVTWHGMGAGTGPDINSLAVCAGELYAAGTLETATPDGGSGVLRWDGSAWSMVGNAFYPDYDIHLVVHDDVLHAAGSFSAIGGVPFDGIARWNGATWDALPSPPVTITEITATDAHIYAAGPVPGGDRAVCEWDGLQWSILGEDVEGAVWALGTWASRPVLGGDFTAIGPEICYGLASWESDKWSAFGGGHGVEGIVGCQLGGTTLHVGGSFSMDGLAGIVLAEWDGEGWQPRGGNPLADGTPYRIEAMDHHEGRIVAALQIKNAQVVTETRIVSLDVNGQDWTVLGEVTRTGSTWSSVPMVVSHGDTLLVGGVFDGIDGVSAPHLAQWDGVAWSPFGLDPGGPVYGLTVFRGQVTIMGEWDDGNGGGNLDGPMLWTGTEWLPLPMNDIDYLGTAALGVHQDQLVTGVRAWVDGDLLNLVRAWNGSNWSTLGEGFSSHVVSLCSFEGELYAGGAFSWIGDTLQRGVGRWDGISWKALGAGLDPYAWITSLAVAGDGLYLGGNILTAGNHASVGLARWLSEDAVSATPLTRPGSIHSIEAIAPNPFNARTEIRFVSEAATRAEIRIYDLKGRRITSLELGRIASGTKRVQWDGMDGAGQAVASGVYLFELRTEAGRRDVKRAVLVK